MATLPVRIENGCALLDPGDHFTRYNGGWTKSVTGLDKSKTNGFSIQGDLVVKGYQWYKIGGLYMDCGVGGSRKNQRKEYNVFTITPKGEIDVLQMTYDDGSGWAVELWDTIEEFLNRDQDNNESVLDNNPLAEFSDEALLGELQRRGLTQKVFPGTEL